MLKEPPQDLYNELSPFSTFFEGRSRLMATRVTQHEFASTTIGGGAVVQQGDRQTTNTYYIEHASIGLRDVPDGPDLAQMLCPAAERLHEMCTRCTHCISSSVHGQTVRESSPSRRLYGGEI